jgi:hypothetical protein
MRKCLKNEIGTHGVSPSFSNSRTGMSHKAAGAAEGSQYKRRAAPNCNFHILDALWMPTVQKLLRALHAMKWMPYHIGSAVCAPEIRARLALPSAAEERSQGINGDFSQRFDAGNG